MDKTFRQKIYYLAKQIPKGKVVTYGQLAKMAGSPGAARAVGISMKQNPDPSAIPCHRVVASNGKLTGYAFGGVNKKKELLLDEGVVFNHELVNLTTSQWKPNL